MERSNRSCPPPSLGQLYLKFRYKNALVRACRFAFDARITFRHLKGTQLPLALIYPSQRIFRDTQTHSHSPHHFRTNSYYFTSTPAPPPPPHTHTHTHTHTQLAHPNRMAKHYCFSSSCLRSSRHKAVLGGVLCDCFSSVFEEKIMKKMCGFLGMPAKAACTNDEPPQRIQEIERKIKIIIRMPGSRARQNPNQAK